MGVFSELQPRPWRVFRYLSVLPLLLLAASLDALAQSPAATGRCDIAAVSTWDPPGESGNPVDIHIDLFVIDLVEINDRLNRFSLDFTLTASWTDPRLASIGNCLAPFSTIWHPQLIFINADSGGIDEAELAEIYPGGQVMFSRRFTLDLNADLQLQSFPFDEQLLTVDIVSMFFGPEDVRLRPQDEVSGVYEAAALPGWTIGSLSSVEFDEPISTPTSSHSALRFTLPVEREYTYYFWRLIFPLALITLMAWAVFWLEPTQLAPQVTVSTGAIFSLMAFLVSQGQILPTVSYLTAADKLIVACVILVFVAFGESILAGTLAQKGRVALAQSFDRAGRWAYLAAVITITVLTATAAS